VRSKPRMRKAREMKANLRARLVRLEERSKGEGQASQNRRRTVRSTCFRVGSGARIEANASVRSRAHEIEWSRIVFACIQSKRAKGWLCYLEV
jgi:hypothetical protein